MTYNENEVSTGAGRQSTRVGDEAESAGRASATPFGVLASQSPSAEKMSKSGLDTSALTTMGTPPTLSTVGGRIPPCNSFQIFAAISAKTVFPTVSLASADGGPMRQS
eukprot:IDg10819t1